jgi:GTP-binding protein EngB required for normal cell division/uncharacterized protein (DUF697 family)
MSIYTDAEELREKLKREQEKKLKVALFGQPGAGKSSLINKLVGGNAVTVGVSTDKTIEAEVVEWEDLLLVDLPGYGTTKFPENKYFDRFKIDSFDIYLCVFSGKFHGADTRFFKELRSNGKVCLFVRNYHDTIWEDGKEINELEQDIRLDVEKQVETKEDVIFTSCRTNYGIRHLSESIYANINTANKAKWAKSAKAYSVEFLEEKKKSCETYVYTASGAAAINSINPIPGMDIGIDVSILLGLFASIRNAYGLTDEKLKSKEALIPALAPMINNIIKYGSKEGVIYLLKTFAGREILKSTSKYIPFVGQALAASIGYGITRSAGISYLDDCHKAAKSILEHELSK